MKRSYAAEPPLGAFVLYFESPQVWVGDELAKTTPALRHEIAFDRICSRDVPILFRRDGFLIFRFEQAPSFSGGAIPAYEDEIGRPRDKKVIAAEEARQKLMYERIEYMNAFLLALTSAMSTVQQHGAPIQEPCDPWHHLRGFYNGASWEVMTANTLYQFPAEARHVVLRLDTFEDAIGVMQACEATFGTSSVTLLSLVYMACYQYRRHQFASAHLIAWCAVESLVNIIWRNFLADAKLQTKKDETTGKETTEGFTAINAERKKMLTSNDYTASIMSQVLSLAGKIDDELLNRLNEARKARNEFAHSLVPVTSDKSSKTIQLATDLITRLCGRQVISQLSFSAYL